MKLVIGTIIRTDADGGCVYVSHKGIIYCDPPQMILNKRGDWVRNDDLAEARKEDRAHGYEV